ncbi:hypothetical protein DTL21_02060 [Bremerella cremea]|uniref:Uncharacterized protein n=1 Tax=Blastopirellula marina TaxID=124 RepID=A0A2S8G556_9BACT|nr:MULTISPECIES: hypothetical protein [Pirellulaceae]PQO39553.1 hypothetical protein C5Y83_02060 [Blastopirellula marina]RCS51020.1 hypothetical protein DTL21_02060 [Bremerella cremea]
MCAPRTVLLRLRIPMPNHWPPADAAIIIVAITLAIARNWLRILKKNRHTMRHLANIIPMAAWFASL